MKISMKILYVDVKGEMVKMMLCLTKVNLLFCVLIITFFNILIN